MKKNSLKAREFHVSNRLTLTPKNQFDDRESSNAFEKRELVSEKLQINKMLRPDLT